MRIRENESGEDRRDGRNRGEFCERDSRRRERDRENEEEVMSFFVLVPILIFGFASNGQLTPT